MYNSFKQNRSPSQSRVGFLQELRIVVVGGGGVGKSALTLQFIQSQFVDEYDPTIEDSYRKQIEVPPLNPHAFEGAEGSGSETLLLDVLDTAGQEEYSAMREQYMKTGQGFMIVYSANSRASFEEAQAYYHQILRVKDRPQYPCILVANKCDLSGERVISKAEGLALARHFNIPHVEASAKRRVNVDESFIALVQEVRHFNRIHDRKRRTLSSTSSSTSTLVSNSNGSTRRGGESSFLNLLKSSGDGHRRGRSFSSVGDGRGGEKCCIL